MKHNRSTFMKFYDRPDDESSTPSVIDEGDDFYGQEDNTEVPPDIVEQVTGKKSEVGGELSDDSHEPASHVTNREEGDTTSEPSQTVDGKEPIKSTGGDDKFERLVETLTERLAPQPQTPQNQQMSPEERARAEKELQEWLKPIAITKQDVIDMGYEDPTDAQVAKLQAIQERTAQHAVRVAQLAMQQMVQPLQQQLEVMGHHVETQQQAEAVDAFYTTYPDLKGRDKVVTMIANQVGSDRSWLQGKTFNQIADRVASETREFLSSLGVSDAQNQGQGNNAGANLRSGPTKSAVPQMQNLSGSGRSPGKVPDSNNEMSGDADVYN